MLLGAIILPMGLVLYGWTAAEHLQWVAPLAGTSLIGFSMILTILPTENYLVDALEIDDDLIGILWRWSAIYAAALGIGLRGDIF